MRGRNMSRLDNALKSLGKAHLLGDDTLRIRAMNDLLHLAGIGSDVVSGRQITTQLFSRSAPSVLWGQHPEVGNVGRTGRHTRGTINGQGAQLYLGNGYRSIVRALAKDGRCVWRPSKGPGGRIALWLTDDEAAIVRAEHATRYKGMTA